MKFGVTLRRGGLGVLGLLSVLIVVHTPACGGATTSTTTEGGPSGTPSTETHGMGGSAGGSSASAWGGSSTADAGDTAGTGGKSAGTASNPSFQFDGSCYATDGTCADHHFESDEDIAYQTYLCTSSGGTWDSAHPCSETGRIGGCSIVYGLPIIVTWYYDADAAVAAKAACTGAWIYH